MKRNYGLDIFRIMCCVGVLNYHVVDDVLGSKLSYFIYYASSFCVPGFFMLSGFLIAMRQDVNIVYFENKIKNTMIKLFGWIIFWATMHFIRTAETLDIFREFINSSTAEGILPVAWFLFTYTILMFVAFPICLARKKDMPKRIMFIIVIAYMVALSFGVGRNNGKPQSLWLYMYLGYFVTGMVISDLVKLIKPIYIKIGSIIMLCVCSGVYLNKWDIGIPGLHYGTWYYTLWLTSIFLLILQIDIKSKKISELIKHMSNNTFTVYLGHLPVLLFITQKEPLTSIQGACIMVVFLFVMLNAVAEIFRKIPLLRKIV